MTHALPSDELRTLVRQVLQEVLPAQPTVAPTPPSPPAPTADTPSLRAEMVVLATDADLDAFVHRLTALCEDPGVRHDLQTGQLRFRLAGAVADANSGPSDQPVVRVERGAITERQVRDAARAGARIVAARSAVVTPLARDRARALGVDIDKER